MSATPRQIADLCSSSAVLLAELAEVISSNALQLSLEEGRAIASLYCCLGRIADGRPLPPEVLALPFERWISEELHYALRPELPPPLHQRLRRAFDAGAQR